MAPQTANELLDWLVRHHFLSENRAQPLREASYSDALALVKELMQREWLTPYQVNQILQGNGASLLLGTYRLLERIGEGAMGQVFKGWDPKLERVVAVKMIHKEHLSSQRAMGRFKQELETASKLDHRNIVLVRDADEIDSRPYMVMEFIEGTDLSRMVKTAGPLPVWQAAEYARQAALGLQHALERNVVHRDIKPGNLLVTREQVVKILDFGLAKFESDEPNAARLTQFGAVLGTIDYIAPEQAENAQRADIRADIYGLGCTLFYLLSGKPPFPGSSIVEKVSARMVGEVPSIRAVRPDVPPGLEAVLKRMMARNLAERYQTPADVAADLEPYSKIENVAPSLPMAAPLAMAAVFEGLTEVVAGPPLAKPVGMPLAQPVANNVPLAADAPPSTGDSFTFTTAAASHSRATAAPIDRPRPGFGAWFTADLRRLFGICAAVLLLLSLLLYLLFVRGAARPLVAPDAAIHLAAKSTEMTFKPGQTKPLVVRIERVKFNGPVSVHIEALPDGVQAESIVIPAKSNTGEIKIIVSYQTPNLRQDVRVVAVAGELRSSLFVSLRVSTLN
ncbi:MAG: serine/threonine protein kinase [Gemmataceae bacterium]|nr:serine/threonine protein kinase [Gemmataceae bacterium]MCI0740231.1 serine/threonine protein kinase [Gemmataceae bacterium]